MERLIKGRAADRRRWSPTCFRQMCLELPLYRQAQMLLALGHRHRARGTCVLGGLCSRRTSWLGLRLREIILIAGKIAVDETIAPVLDPGRGRTKKGFFGAIALRRRGCRSSVKMAVFTPNP